MLTSSFAALLLLGASTAFAQSNDTCYRKSNNQVRPQPSGWFACEGTEEQSGGIQLCCINGSECGPDSICRREGTGDDSRWYVGGCTDENYNDPMCRNDCSKFGQFDTFLISWNRWLINCVAGDKQTYITYNNSQSQWQCCGKDGCEETSPTDETFKAISPSDWKPINGNSTDPDDDNDDDSDDDSGLSTPAKIGIGVGAGVAVLAIIAILLFFFRSGVKRSRQNHAGMKGRYEQIPIPQRSVSPQPPQQQQPPAYAPGATYARSRSPSPQPEGGRFREEVPDATSPVPTMLRPGQGGGPRAPDQISMMSRD